MCNRCGNVEMGAAASAGRLVLGAEGATVNVRGVLAAKGDAVRTAHPWHSVEEVVRRLAGPPRVGALVVVGAGGTILGTINEQDIARGLHEHGPDLLGLEAERLMRRHVPTCRPDDGLDHVMRVMTNARRRHLPVVDGGELVGIVSIGDVVLARLADIELEAAVLRDVAIVRS
jgi:CBS domain-containing protein